MTDRKRANESGESNLSQLLDSDSSVERLHSTDELHELLSHHRRRWVLQYLRDCSTGWCSLKALAEHVTELDRERGSAGSPGLERRVAIELYHVHLPRLAQFGAVDFDQRTRTVRYTGNRLLDHYLKYRQCPGST